MMEGPWPEAIASRLPAGPLIIIYAIFYAFYFPEPPDLPELNCNHTSFNYRLLILIAGQTIIEHNNTVL